MKGFIEVTNARVFPNEKQLINISRIRGVSGPSDSDPENVKGAVAFDDGTIDVTETYEELKGLIERAV